LPIVAFSAADTSGCAPLCVEFINGTGIQLTSAQWEFGDGSTSSFIDSALHCYTTAGAYNVKLTVTDTNGCSGSLQKSNMINLFPSPVADFDMDPKTVSTLNPTVNFTDKSVNASQWVWSFGDVKQSGSTEQNPFYIYSDSGYYNVRLIVNNEFGCLDTAYKTFHIGPEYMFYAPNAFTPNGDGLNDEFLPLCVGANIETFEMYIYDRWGDQIFHTTNILEGWDGRANGGKDIVQEDVYVWKINVRDTQSVKHNYVGHISVVQ
jgi:gliding motility-associated-like protein